MKILGISAFYHDSAAALVVDGVVVAAIQEERLSRKKHDNSFPIMACKWCLEYSHLSISDIDLIVFYEKPFVKFERILETSIAFAPKSYKSFLKAMPVWLGGKLNMRSLISKTLKNELNCKTIPEIQYIEHHKAHAAFAYYTSVFPETAILVMDAVGEKATTSLMVAKNGEMQTIKEQHFPHSIGMLYSAVTQYLGFKVNSDEYKVMGLAPYGDAASDETVRLIKTIKEELVRINEDGSIRLNTRHFVYPYGLKMIDIPHWERLFGMSARTEDGEISQQHKNLAFAIQTVIEEIATRLAQTIKDETGLNNLCIAGGCAMNCVMNGAISRLELFDNIHVPFAPDDSGCAIGAALAVEGKQTLQNANPYTGTTFNDAEIRSVLNEQNSSFENIPDEDELCELAAKHLADGLIVGWFQGRMEFGARALGNRSILADARNAEMKNRINSSVKFREPFRPFAPVVMKEYASDYFSLAQSPYMMFTSQVLSEKIPAVTHIDKSARIQTVSSCQNVLLYKLLEQYHKQTGISVLLNTSFNVMGEPIVCSPEDALRTFNNSGIEILVMGHYIIKKKL